MNALTYNWRTEAQAEGKAEILLRQLGKRFGKIAPAIRRRIERASIKDLNAWADRVINAPILEAVLDGKSGA